MEDTRLDLLLLDAIILWKKAFFSAVSTMENLRPAIAPL
jgi:hypothetical protein